MSIPSWARKGTLVVCVDADSGKGVWIGDAPVEGHIYTLTGAWVAEDGFVDCSLAEIQRSPSAQRLWGKRVGYHLRRFRPLVEDSYDNEIEAKFYRTRKQQKTQRIPHLGPVS